MQTVFLLYVAVFVVSSICVPARARISRRLVTREERNADGKDEGLYTRETVIEELREDGEDAVKEEEVERKLSYNRKRFLHKREVVHKVECTSMKPPNSGSIFCIWNSAVFKGTGLCRAQCIENYKFPDGSAVKSFNCTQQGEFWNKVDQVPDCQPAKGGIGCDKNIDGGKQLQSCLITSTLKQCESKCITGYRFPNGETKLSLTCKKSTGVYDPIDKFPDCVVAGDKDGGELTVDTAKNEQKEE